MQTSVETLEIQAPDGVMPAVFCVPGDPPAGQGGDPGPAVLVLMEAFGLNDHVREVSRRLAGAGYAALAPDLYYREEVSAIPYDDPDRAADRVMRTVALSDAPEERVKDERALADVRAALQALKKDARVDAARIGVLGLSSGGRLAFLTACREADSIRALVAFYAGRIVPIVEECRGLRAPALLIFGEKDPGISSAQVDRIGSELEHREKPHEIETYAGAAHGFLSEDRGTHHPLAAQRAWGRALGWLGRHLGA